MSANIHHYDVKWFCETCYLVKINTFMKRIPILMTASVSTRQMKGAPLRRTGGQRHCRRIVLQGAGLVEG